MKASISRRIFNNYFINSILSISISVAFILIVLHDMEDEVMTMDLEHQLSMLQENPKLKSSGHWSSPLTKAMFIKKGQTVGAVPKIFEGISPPFYGEREIGEQSFHISVHRTAEGDYYIAKDVTEFESLEERFELLMAALCVAIILLNFFLSRITLRKIVGPLQALSSAIHKAAFPKISLVGIQSEYKDLELEEIASAFNSFSTEIKCYVDRERTLVSLASHELRTPIAVLSGAMQVLEKRGNLSPEDLKTSHRVMATINEMKDVVEALLTISRNNRGAEVKCVRVDLVKIIQTVISDLSIEIPQHADRTKLNIVHADVKIKTDPVLAKITIRNLIRNALAHTRGTVRITITSQWIDIIDQGEGIPEDVLNWFKNRTNEFPRKEGLGLYIVTLSSEALGWEISQSTEPGFGQGLRLCHSIDK